VNLGAGRQGYFAEEWSGPVTAGHRDAAPDAETDGNEDCSRWWSVNAARILTLGHPLLQHRDPAGPPDPLGDHRRRLRNALLSDPATGFNDTNFPLKAIYLYGALFTALLAISYAPTFLSWRDRTLETIRSIYGIPRDGRVDENWHEGRTQLERLMRVNTTLASSLTTALGIFAPIISSLITVYGGRRWCRVSDVVCVLRSVL
jgi:hypothetical protein